MTSTTSRIPLSEPTFSGNEWKYVKDCLDRRWVSSAGDYVTEFENSIKNYVKSEYAVATMNGTSALHISLMLSDVGPEDEVLVPTLTFIAPVNTVAYLGAKPVFMDCDESLNLDPLKLADFCKNDCSFNGSGLINKRSGARIKVILLVHIFGHPANIEPIKEICSRYNLTLIEDATESLGSHYKGGKYESMQTGTIGDIGCYSFNGNKIITCGGGGMLVTSNKGIAQKARYLTTQAKDDPEQFIHNEVGYNYRLTNVQAAIGCAQLEQLDQFVHIKRDNFTLYDKAIREIDGLRVIPEPEYSFSNYWAYTLNLDSKKYPLKKDQLLSLLRANNIEARPVWELNHRQRPYRKCQSYNIAKAIEFHENCINLPCSVSLKEEEIQRICGLLADV